MVPALLIVLNPPVARTPKLNIGQLLLPVVVTVRLSLPSDVCVAVTGVSRCRRRQSPAAAPRAVREPSNRGERAFQMDAVLSVFLLGGLCLKPILAQPVPTSRPSIRAC